MKNFLTLAHERYSCRKFSGKPVEREKLDKIIEAALVAPTAANYQPVKLWLLQSPEALAKVAQATPFPFVKQASAVFVVGGIPDKAWVRHFDGKNYADVDASIVATHMLLEISDLGLGSTWVGHFDPAKLTEQFPQMASHDLIALLPVGYPADDAAPFGTHETYKPKEELMSVL